MGLDLSLNRIKNNNMNCDDMTELTYGRKTWMISKFFEDRALPLGQSEIKEVDNDLYFEIPKKAVDEFYTTFEPYKSQIDYWLQFCKDETPEDKFTKACEELENIYYVCMDDADEIASFQLGIEWEMRALSCWLDQYNEIIQAYLDGDKVIMVRSY